MSDLPLPCPAGHPSELRRIRIPVEGEPGVYEDVPRYAMFCTDSSCGWYWDEGPYETVAEAIAAWNEGRQSPPTKT